MGERDPGRHETRRWGRPLSALKAAGVDVWYDQKGLYIAGQWIDVLERELQSREIFLLIISTESWGPERAPKEHRLAVGQHKRIVGAVHKATELSGFITTYRLFHAVGVRAGQAAQQLLAALSR